MPLEPAGTYRYLLRKQNRMLADVVVYVNENFKKMLETDLSLQQLVDAACLEGVVSPVVGMPDIHQGYGLPIGGVLAMDAARGLISAGAVGMDINCGVRLLSTDIPAQAVSDNPELLQKLLDVIETYIPAGVGRSGHHPEIQKLGFENIVTKGSPLLVKNGYGDPTDPERTEENGCLDGASLDHVSPQAIRRGRDQLGSLGSGNHFIDVQEIEEIYEPAIADQFGLTKGSLVAMIHCGSRGFGHQICCDYTNILWNAARQHNLFIPQKGLAAAPIHSEEGQQYFSAMAAAVNFAFANRQLILHDLRQAFCDVFGPKTEVNLVYDVAHNIAKYEKHNGRELLIHRKGATRALPPKHPQNPPVYRETGHPVLIPGSMGTSSYVLVGEGSGKSTVSAESSNLAEKPTVSDPAAGKSAGRAGSRAGAGKNTTEAGNATEHSEAFYSVNHGAGRLMSRKAAHRTLKPDEFKRRMQGILVSADNFNRILDEAPDVYKDIDEVVDIIVTRKMAKKVAKLKPLAVLIGKE